jgi:hypothetical protein
MSTWDMVERLSSSHDIAEFECGESALDEWFHEQALRNSHLVQTHVCLDADRRIRGFFAFKQIAVSIVDAASKLNSGAQEGFNTGALLTQMALCSGDRGTGTHGHDLLIEALRVAKEARERVAFGFLFVDPVNERVADFYRSRGFKEIVPQGRRLYMTMSAVAKIVAMAAE